MEKAQKRSLSAILFVLATALVLCFFLMGCGSSDSYADNFKGTWDLYEITGDSDSEVTHENVESLAESGYEFYLILGDDGVGEMNTFGSISELTWEATSATECSVTMSSTNNIATLSDDKLSFPYGDMTLVLVKGEDREMDATSVTSSS